MAGVQNVLGLQRYKMAFVAFLGVVSLYGMRVNFSVAILCMTKAPNMTSHNLELPLNITTWSRDQSRCGTDSSTRKEIDKGDGREFEWDKHLQSRVLSSFFYGYILTQVLGGWLARRYGARSVIGYGTAVCAVCTLLTPVCARTHVALIFVLRVISGLSTGMAFPAMHCLWGRWAPPLERTRLNAMHTSGQPVGIILTFIISGYLCAYGFDNGWGSTFYVPGIGTCLWLVLWFYVVHNTPELHPRISQEERVYIETAIGDRYLEDERKIKTPWAAMMKSPAMWANIIAHFCNNWTTYTLLIGLPMYMREVLNFDIKQNGALSAIPYICQFISALATGFTADSLRSRGILSTVNTRRLLQCTSFLGVASFMIATGYVTCENRVWGVVFLSLATTFQGLCRSGYLVNHIDIGPRYAGEQLGITSTVATVPGMIVPLVNASLTPYQTPEEWQRVFFLCGGIAIFGTLSFGFLVRGEVQPWAKAPVDAYDLPKTKEEILGLTSTVLNDGYEIIIYPNDNRKGT